MVTMEKADVSVVESGIGGLEEVKVIQKQHAFTGEKVPFRGEPNTGLICLDESWCCLLGCTIENTGEGGAGIRYSEFAGGLIESCLVQFHDVGIMLDGSVRVAVYSSLFQHNVLGAFYAGRWMQEDAEVELVDNTICTNSMSEDPNKGMWATFRKPARLTVSGNRENW
ncbi:hypothetical protein GUITHDRAFT_154749 [Guillardia theta CCMP2712]|uniref:Right handed beta helix domain-containing protein n=1 Tax=Guillardia theta (strain CCMP2712) TaxID=905079 RepID=L1IR88_GUITC|nr:hypothetical protein GUITHDRAFT_154749 [Guillardia theta CCMP2712]EKX38409.1 hypothetical protein GUITHDRAFT_154749 [Guillardia theta CCMP2712]|eukprot:XP_005825389.1 hypothetical protein GUITHDRAFT_154749 [Guillardia theta CCMP2712]